MRASCSSRVMTSPRSISGQHFTEVGFCQRKIVAFFGGTLGDPFANELPRSLFDRGILATRDIGA